MEEKILVEMRKGFNELSAEFKNQLQETNEKFESKFQEVNEKFESKFQEMNENFENKLQEIDQKFEKKFDEVHQEIKEIRGRQLVFESEYGTKIDAIFDAVTMELDKNLEKSEKIRKLEKRMDRQDVVMFGYEKRISNLELKR